MRPSRPSRSTRRHIACVLAATLFALPAGSLQRAAAETSAPYRLGVGDIVAITVYGRNELSGRFPISPDGSIGFPMLGNLAAAGRTPADFGTEVDRLLAEHIPGLSVAVSVFQYAPVFVVGDVQTPGRYEFRPGMTALELVALGGGMRRATAALENTQLQMIAARQDYADLELQIFAQEAARVRLQAELDGVAYQPDKAAAADTNPSWRAVKESVIAGEQRFYDIRLSAMKAEDEALAAQESSYEDEIRKVTESIALHKQEIDLILEDVDAQKELTSRGLTAKSNLREAERNLSSMRRDALELGSYLARAQQNKLAIQQKRVTLTTTRRNDAARQLQEAEINVARMRARQQSLLETMSELALMAGEGVADGEERQPNYSIMRMTDGNYQEVAAGEQMSLRPGDILRVAQAKADPRRASIN